MLLIWALTLMTTVVIGNSGSGNSNNEETTEEHEVRVQREIEEANAIQDRRIKRKTERELCDGERVRFPPLRIIKCHDLERRNHGLRSKWFKVLNAVTNCTSNIPEKPSVKQMVTIMEAGKHMVMAPSLAYDVDQTSNSINTMYDYLRKNEVSRTTGTHKRKNIGSSSSHSQSLPRNANKKKKNRLVQFQQVLDKREQDEISV